MQIVQVLTSSSQPFVSRLAGADLPRLYLRAISTPGRYIHARRWCMLAELLFLQHLV